MEDWKIFEKFIIEFAHPNETIRKNAETEIYSCSENPDNFISLLMQVLLYSETTENKQCVVVLLYKMCFSKSKKEKSIWQSARNETRESCLNTLLKVIEVSEIDQILRSTCEAICKIIHYNKKNCSDFRCCLTQFLDNNEWNALLPQLLQLTQSSQSTHRHSAYFILANSVELFQPNTSNYIPFMLNLFQNALSTNEPDLKVRINALRASVAFILSLTVSEEREHFIILTPLFLHIIAETFSTPAKNNNIINTGKIAFQALIDLAGASALYFRPNLRIAFSTMLIIANNEELNVHTRGYAIEFLVTLAEKKPGMIRNLAKHGNECDQLLQTLFKMMINITDDINEWSSIEELEDEEEDFASLGEQSLDRLSRSLGGKTILPSAFTHISEMLNNQDWKFRYSALKAISSLAEGSSREIFPQLSAVVNLILNCIQDTDPRVRYAACHALGQLATDLQPKLQQNHHSGVLRGLLTCMNDSSHRVQAHAATALINFSEYATEEIFEPYLNEIAFKLYNMLSSSHRLVLDQTITTLAVFADSIGDQFSPFYNEFIPILKTIFINCNNNNNKELRGKAIECITLIGQAVQSNMFKPDAHWIMKVLEQEFKVSGLLSYDDVDSSYILSSQGRICKVLGLEFVQYLPFVLPPLLETAQLEPEVSIVSADSQEAHEEDDKEWDYIYMSNYKIGIKSSILEDKCTGCEMINVYLETLKGGLSSCLKDIFAIMLPLVDFVYHNGVRSAAIESLPHFLSAAIDAGYSNEEVHEMWTSIFNQSISIFKEDDLEVISETLTSLKLCILTLMNVSKSQFLSFKYCQEISAAIECQFEFYFKRIENQLCEQNDCDYDEEAQQNSEDSNVNDELFICRITDLIASLFYGLETTAIAFFELLLPLINEILHNKYSSDAYNQSFILNVLGDFIRYQTESSFLFAHKLGFQNLLLKGIHSKNPYLCKTACYVLGNLSRYGGPNYSKIVYEFIPHCMDTIMNYSCYKNDNSSDRIYVYENAVSALGKICRYSYDTSMKRVPSREQLLSLWLQCLPLQEDDEECLFTVDYLCELIESGDSIILGENNYNIKLLCNILQQGIQIESVKSEKELYQRCINILSKFGIPSSTILGKLNEL